MVSEIISKIMGTPMKKSFALTLLSVLLIAGCMSRNQITDPPCGVKETEAGLCKQPPAE